MHNLIMEGSFATKVSVVIVAISVVGASMPDWLVTKVNKTTTISKTSYGTVLITNGLVSREFSLYPDFATIDIYSHEKDMSVLRAVGPEAVIGIDGIVYNIGGLITDTPRAYLNKTHLSQNAKYDPTAFNYVTFNIGKPVAPYPYRPMRGAPSDIEWPPKGLRLDVQFKAPFWAPEYHQMITVTVHYEVYDGIPLVVKWLSVSALPYARQKEVRIYSVEYLAVNQQWGRIGYNGQLPQGSPQQYDVPYQWPTGYSWMYVETNEPHGTEVRWLVDPSAGAMPGSFEPVVNCSYQMTPEISIGDGFDTFRVHELLIGTSDLTRTALSKHRMFRMLAPQAQENPIFFHMMDSTSAAVRSVIDQLAETGFEMLIYSFGSGFYLESNDASYIQHITEDVQYARNKGIEMGGYDLIALSRSVELDWMAVNANNQSIGSACFASGWRDNLTSIVTNFIEKTGLKMVETDGPYGGYSCSSRNHIHHRGVEDSVYQQNKLQGDFYRTLRKLEIYINQPDYYFYHGASKTAMGYNENQYSLPRWQDISISRQTVYDNIYFRIPTAGWMFVPLLQYHAGGKAAQFEPLSDHLVEYEWALAQYMGAGVAACYRGLRLYDSDETKAIVIKWVNFYKKYRQILISDIVHVRRPDMQDIDSFMHVNPKLQHRGLAMVFNPTKIHIKKSLTLPLYYTGLTNTAMISEQGMNKKIYFLDRGHNVEVPINLPPLKITWFLVEQ